jgi:hypothetical protein
MCTGAGCKGSVQNEADQGLGVLLRGVEATRAWQHAECCRGATVSLRIRREDGSASHVPVRFVHLYPDPFDSTSCVLGMSLDVAGLETEAKERAMRVWTELQAV